MTGRWVRVVPRDIDVQAGDVVDLDGFGLRRVPAEAVDVLNGSDGVRAIYRAVWIRDDGDTEQVVGDAVSEARPEELR